MPPPPTSPPHPVSADVAVVGAGPNGLAAAIELARRGARVIVFEAAGEIGGGLRSAHLTRPGFIHDVCAGVVPFAAGSPYLRRLPLEEFDLEYLHPPVAVAHPLDDGSAAAIVRDLDATASGLGADGDRYRRIVGPLVDQADALFTEILQPVLHVPRHPIPLARFGLHALRSVTGFAAGFSTEPARALWAGLGAHAVADLDMSLTNAVALSLAVSAHAYGWPVVAGGTGRLASAMSAYLEDLGVTIVTERPVTSLDGLPDVVVFDLAPEQVAAICGSAIAPRRRRRLEKWQRGPGAFKVDWALDAPIPWRAEICRRAGTVHVGGTLDEIAAAEAATWRGHDVDHPFVLVAQPTIVDPSRAPEGKHTAWGYCHVPAGSTRDMTDRIERQIERFAPGFRDLVIGRHVMGPRDLETHNATLIGGDITGGAMTASQILARPFVFRPYRLSDDLYLGSASTPPGAGVHGMAGFHAAEAALRRLALSRPRPSAAR